MSNQKSQYNKGGNYIKELPMLHAPSINYHRANEKDIEAYMDDQTKYSMYLSNLRTIPCHESTLEFWSDGKIVVEGIDYNITKNYELAEDSYGYLYAMFRLSSVEDNGITKENELWNEIGAIFNGTENFTCYANTLEKLKSKYTLIKK